MKQEASKLQADVVIAGSGPGGCAVAAELSRTGKKVILIEKGTDSKALLGNPLGTARRLERDFPYPTRRTLEGDALVLAHGLGGGTVIFAGAASPPDTEYWKRYEVHLPRDLTDEATKECWVSTPPDEFIGPGARRVRQAAGELGIPFAVQDRHVDFEKCIPGCEKCTYGCPHGAKWTAREYAEQAVGHGAQVLTRVTVTDVVIKQGRAAGVRAVDRSGDRFAIHAEAVVLAAGGVHTAEILRNSGVYDVGRRFTGDPTVFTFGFVKKGPGNGREHNMTMGYHDEKHDVLFCSMAPPALAWHVQFMQDEGLTALKYVHRFRRVLSLFAKISDQGRGRITSDGNISKTFTSRDRERFQYARALNEKILIEAGCVPGDIHHSGFTLGHPSGTVGVGRALDANLETQVKNLYCCDTSVFPEAPGRPPTLTVVVLGKRLAGRLLEIL